MILGSGWNEVIKEVEVGQEWDYSSVFGSAAGVAGHAGKLILGKLEEKPVWIMAGRFHTYEGYSTEEVTRPIQAFAKLGVKNLIITSAAGGLNSSYLVGDIVILSDILALFCQSPLTGATFQDLSQPFDSALRENVIEICDSEGIPFQSQGVYAYVRGPHYESFADKKALQSLGADCVGMSTVPETIMANHLGLKVLGLSCITNLAFVKHSHQEVVAAAEAVKGNMTRLLKGITLQIAN